MSASKSFTIFLCDDSWRIGVVEHGEARIDTVHAPDDARLEDHARLVRQHLETLGYADHPVVLALASAQCPSATFSIADLDRGGRREAMGYLLEEHLPIAAEDFVADHLIAGGDDALGVCAEYEPLHAVVESLEALGVRVRHICPTSLLAAAHLAEQLQADVALIRDHSDSNGTADSIEDTGHIDLIEFDRSKPRHWWWMADDSDELHSRLTSITADNEQPRRLITIGCTCQSVPADLVGSYVFPDAQPVDRDTAAALFASRLLEGAASPWIDLRRDRLASPGQLDVYRGPVTALVVAIVLLCVAVIGVSWWRGERYNSIADANQRAQSKLYVQAMGAEPPQSSARLRFMRSEHRDLALLAGQGTDEQGKPPIAVSALDRLGEVLATVPRGLRFRLLEMNFEPDRVRLTGEARSHAEAEQIAIALRKAGYEIDAPKTRSLRTKGVSFTLIAVPTASTNGDGNTINPSRSPS